MVNFQGYHLVYLNHTIAVLKHDTHLYIIMIKSKDKKLFEFFCPCS